MTTNNTDGAALLPVTPSDEEIAAAARQSLGEWLAWPDAGRDGPREVTNEQVKSWLSGLPNKIASLTNEAASHRQAYSLPRDVGMHPDIEGHIADAVRDACGIVLGKVVSFDDSRGIAATIADRIKIANAEYAAALTPSPLPATQEDAERSGAGVSDAVELQEAFDMRWKADMRAVAMWRAENPSNDLVLPDHADLVVWLLDQGDAIAEAAFRVLKSAGKWTPDHYELSAHVTTFRDGAALSTPAMSDLQRLGQEMDTGVALQLEALEQIAADMEHAVGGGMMWIDHSEAAEFCARIRRVAATCAASNQA